MSRKDFCQIQSIRATSTQWIEKENDINSFLYFFFFFLRSNDRQTVCVRRRPSRRWAGTCETIELRHSAAAAAAASCFRFNQLDSYWELSIGSHDRLTLKSNRRLVDSFSFISVSVSPFLAKKEMSSSAQISSAQRRDQRVPLFWRLVQLWSLTTKTTTKIWLFLSIFDSKAHRRLI